MRETYILQKEWFFSAKNSDNGLTYHKGEKLVKQQDYPYYEICSSGVIVHQDWVENNPEWFLPEENKSNDSFQWTDELVYDFARIVKLCGDKNWIHEQMEIFKRARAKCEVCGVKIKSGARFCGNHWREYVQNTWFKFQKHIIDTIPPKPQAENKPDWEIVAFKGSGGMIYQKTDQNIDAFTCFENFGHEKYIEADFLNNSSYKIHSVKRLSDGEVFSVGDEVVYCGINSKITAFHISATGNTIHVVFFDGTVEGTALLNDLKKQPQKQRKMPANFLFTTEDGKDIFHNDMVWVLNESLALFHRKAGKGNDVWNQPPYPFRYFSTKEAAEKYIADNKPQPQKEEQRIDVDLPLGITMREIASCITNYVRKDNNPIMPDAEATVIDHKKLEEVCKTHMRKMLTQQQVDELISFQKKQAKSWEDLYRQVAKRYDDLNEQVDELCEKAFNAGSQILSMSGDRRGKWKIEVRFPTYQDYKQSKS